MTPHTNSQFLQAKVLTAPAHRLHLMLIEGAIRFGRQAHEALSQGNILEAAPPLMRMLDVVGELLAGVRDKNTELNRKLAGLYWFLFRSVSLAKIHGDAQMLAEVLNLLEYERETWQLACDKLAAESLPAPGRIGSPPVPHSVSSSLSLEA